MTGLAGEIARLFAAPGGAGASAVAILRAAATVHRELLHVALAEVEPRCGPALPLLVALLPQDGATAQRRFLTDPVLIEGLHELVHSSVRVRDWHDCTADPVCHGRDGPADSARPAVGLTLGNSALSLLLRVDPQWCGIFWMRTDCFGSLRFPLSDWSLSLTTAGEHPCLLSEEPVALQLTRHVARFAIGSEGKRPVMSMPRALLVRLIARNDPAPEPSGIVSLDTSLRSRWQWAAPLCSSGARFLPVHCARDGPQADRCGTVVRHLHDRLAGVSPAVHREFCRLIDAIHGFELPGRPDGLVQSFSEPTRPRLVGFNVPFDDSGAPCGDPFAVTCLGHEMAHSKMYLVGSIGWQRGWRLLNNPGDCTGVLPRYGRSLGVRTLFQIPYTHLYEWTIHIDACAVGLNDGPPAFDDPQHFGDDLRDEILEAFEAIDELVELTAAGAAALAHFRRLYDDTHARWKRLYGSRAGPIPLRIGER